MSATGDLRAHAKAALGAPSAERPQAWHDDCVRRIERERDEAVAENASLTREVERRDEIIAWLLPYATWPECKTA